MTDQRTINIAVNAMQEAGDRAGIEMTTADLEILLRAALPYLTITDGGVVAPQQAANWQWGTHAKGSVNVIQRADEAAARRAVQDSNGRLKLYYRRSGSMWELVDE